MDNKEKTIIKQAVLKASVNLVGTLRKDNATPKELANETLEIAEVLFNWVIEGVDLNSTKAVKTTNSSFEPKCPACDSFVWDNRDTASNGQPVWRCKNDDCTGGTFSKKYNKVMAWASWDENEFANAELQAKTNGVDDAKVNSVNNAGVVESEEFNPFD